MHALLSRFGAFPSFFASWAFSRVKLDQTDMQPIVIKRDFFRICSAVVCRVCAVQRSVFSSVGSKCNHFHRSVIFFCECCTGWPQRKTELVLNCRQMELKSATEARFLSSILCLLLLRSIGILSVGYY